MDNPAPFIEPAATRNSSIVNATDVFPFDKPRKKYVGGGGVIAKYSSPFRSKLATTGSTSLSSKNLPSHLTLTARDLGQENIHAEIRLDQVSQIQPKIQRKKSSKKSPKKSSRKKSRPKSSHAIDLGDSEAEELIKPKSATKKKRKLKKSKAVKEDSFEDPKLSEYDQV